MIFDDSARLGNNRRCRRSGSMGVRTGVSGYRPYAGRVYRWCSSGISNRTVAACNGVRVAVYTAALTHVRADGRDRGRHFARRVGHGVEICHGVGSDQGSGFGWRYSSGSSTRAGACLGARCRGAAGTANGRNTGACSALACSERVECPVTTLRSVDSGASQNRSAPQDNRTARGRVCSKLEHPQIVGRRQCRQ